MSGFVIAKLGACSALGTEASGIQAELAAGSSAFEHHLGPQGAVTMAALETLPIESDQLARRRALLAHAIDDLLAGLTFFNPARAGLVQASADTTETAFGEILAHQVRGAGLEPLPIQARSHGRSSWFAALLLARELLTDEAYDVVFVFASDSRCDRASVAALARATELLGDDNSDGLVPGEGACIALCCRPGFPLARLPSAMWCEAVAIGDEPQPFRGSEPNLSQGLTNVFRALASEPIAVDVVIDCQTGQTRFTKEFHAAYLRCGSLMPEPLVRSSTAAAFGEAGSATAGLAMVMAQHELAARNRALVYSSGDDGLLGAAILVRVGGRSALQERLEQREPRPRSAFHSRTEVIDDHLETCGYLQLDRFDDLSTARIPWFELVGVELRIQAHLDALALGGAATIERARAGLEGWSADRRQGSALVAGAWFAVGELADEVTGLAATLDDDELDELASTLALATKASPILLALVRHPTPNLRRLGLELASSCVEVFTSDVAACLSDAEVQVRGAAALCLARRSASEFTNQLLVAADADPECVGLPAALVWLGHERAIERLRWLLRQRPELAVESARWLAMCGDANDQQAISERLMTFEPNVAIADVLGTVGLPGSLPHLLAALERDDEMLRVAAARALDRMTGAGLREQLIDDHGVVEVQRCLDAARWRDWLEQYSNHLPTGRMRDGQAWSLRAVWNELCAGTSELSRRRLAVDELSLSGAVRVHLDVRSSITAQRWVMARWGEALGFEAHHGTSAPA